MRIAFVNRHPDDVVGGSEIQCDMLASELARAHDIIYIAPAGCLAKNYRKNYTVVPVGSNSRSISDAIIKAKPDIVYWRFNKYYFHLTARRLAKHRIPIVFAVSHINDTKLCSHRENIKNGPKSILKAIKQSILTCWNHTGFRYVQGVTVDNNDHLRLAPVKNKIFIPNTITKEASPFAWDRPYIIWVSNIKPAKRPELYVNLAKEFERDGIDFLMIGNIQSSSYDWITDKEKTPDNFHYLGPKTLEEVNGAIKNSLFLVHTCMPEGFGIVFLQAWLQSKPTISYDFEPCGYITNEKLGNVAHGNWDNFVNISKNFIENKSLRDEIGQRAREFSTHKFSSQESANKLEQFLLRIKENYSEAQA